mmetsp:Transcript_22379/g.62163  ORF Transcript_22379/g.62163 Transcript_22379/m.62163 type:complete len:89 (+) Transcript_22379:3919-4185(+)
MVTFIQAASGGLVSGMMLQYLVLVVKAFFGDETLEDRAHDKVGVPKQSKKRNDREDGFDKSPPNAVVVPDGSIEQCADPTKCNKDSKT